MTIADIIEVQQVKILQQTEVDIDLGNHNVNLCRWCHSRKKFGCSSSTSVPINHSSSPFLLISHEGNAHIYTHIDKQKFFASNMSMWYVLCDILSLGHIFSSKYEPCLLEMWKSCDQLCTCTDALSSLKASRAPDKVQIKLTTNQSS